MKILVYGVGGIGGYLGAYLLKTNHEVFFISRGKGFKSIKDNGLRIISELGNINLDNINIVDKIDDANLKFDFVVLAVKLYDLKSVLGNLQKLKYQSFQILPFQNGIFAEEEIENIYGKENTIGAVAQISSYIDEKNRVIHKGKLATFFVGNYFDGYYSKKLEILTKDCQSIGLDLRFSSNIKEKLWEKFIFLSAYSGMTTLSSLSIGEIFSNKDLKKMFIQAMHETFKLSEILGVKFRHNPVDLWIEKIKKMPFDMTSSMFLDFKNKKKLELDWLSGNIVVMSKKLKIKSPVHKRITEKIKDS